MRRLLRKIREAYTKPRDTRELIHVPGIGVMTCDRYKEGGAVPTMRAVDAMPPERKALVHEFGGDAFDYGRLDVATARRMLEAKFAKR